MITKGKHRQSGRLDTTPVLTYENLQAIAAARLAAGPHLADPSAGRLSMDTDANDDGWHGSMNMERALDLLAHGDPKATARVQTLADAFHYADAVQPSWEYAVAGSRVCVASYLAGHPECMLTRDTEIVPRPRIRLVANASVSASTSAESVMCVSAAVTCVLQQLQADGHEVAFGCIDYSRAHNGTTYLAPYAVLEFGQTLDISRVAFALHPAMQRRMQFAVRELDSDFAPDVRDNGYGHPGEVTRPMAEFAFGADVLGASLTVILPATMALAQKYGTDVPAITAHITAVVRGALEMEEQL